jgi:hypothetical protein
MAYGDKRDYNKIDIYVDGQYEFSTTWARNIVEARLKASEKLGVDVSRIRGKYVRPMQWTRTPYLVTMF